MKTEKPTNYNKDGKRGIKQPNGPTNLAKSPKAPQMFEHSGGKPRPFNLPKEYEGFPKNRR